MSTPNYLEQKWRSGFHFMDTDGDGLVSEADMLVTSSEVAKHLGITKDQAKLLETSWVHWFYHFREDASVQGISEDKWVAALKTNFEKDLERGKHYSYISYSELFDLLDMDKDGKVSLEELGIYYKSHNVTDKEFVKKVFDKLDVNGDGAIRRDEMIKAGINFWWNPDPAEGYGFIYDRPDLTVKQKA